MEKLLKNLEDKIKEAYETSVTVEEAEKLAAEFLFAQFKLTSELELIELSSRMKKTGVKAIKAALLLDLVQKADKKPTDSILTAMIDSNELVIGEQKSFDETDSYKLTLERYYDICREAHIYFRNLSKGSFNG